MIFGDDSWNKDPLDFVEEDSAERIGARIRRIRTARGMSQSELGYRVGLNADRIQKYENGARKPKIDMLKKIAMALGVKTFALADPVPSTEVGAMFTMFELERNYGMKIEKTPDDKPPGFCIYVDFRNVLYSNMEEWYKIYSKMQVELGVASSDEERAEIVNAYNNWEWTFPRGLIDKTRRDLEKIRIKEKIEELQEVYNQLQKEDSED